MMLQDLGEQASVALNLPHMHLDLIFLIATVPLPFNNL